MARLVDAHKTWSKIECRYYAGQTVRFLDERDVHGRRLAVVTSGPMIGSSRWFGDDEINAEESPETVDYRQEITDNGCTT